MVYLTHNTISSRSDLNLVEFGKMERDLTVRILRLYAYECAIPTQQSDSYTMHVGTCQAVDITFFSSFFLIIRLHSK